MSISISFTAQIAPIAKGRTRIGRSKKGRPVAITPAKTRRWEAAFAAIAAKHAPKTVIDEPIFLDILAILPRPKRLMRKSDPDGIVWAPVKPDYDNIAKACADAMSAWWRDDAVIVGGQTFKVYAEKDGPPRVRVLVYSAPEPQTLIGRRSTVLPDWRTT